MKTVQIEKLVQDLNGFAAEDFCVVKMPVYLRENPVSIESLAPYLFFSNNCYTRNLIFRNEHFELMTLCWEVGQASMIHDHADQNCWMAMPQGKLNIKNFRILEQNLAANFCRLAETESFNIEQNRPAEVEPDEPVHQVSNLPEFNQRAVSLHIYSRPIDRCQVFSIQKNEMRERIMCYTSKFGKLCDGARL